MNYRILSIILPIFILLAGVSCREEELLGGASAQRGDNLPVQIEVYVEDFPETRGLQDESKKSFSTGEIIHIRGEFKIPDTESPEGFITEIQYGVMKYSGKGNWAYDSSEYQLTWPRTAVSASFTAYYLYGSTGILTEETMPAILLSDFKYGQDPLCGVTMDVEYGHTVRFDMKHLFTHLELTQITSGISNEMYFAMPYDAAEGSHYQTFNNAFRLEFNAATKEISGVFLRVPSENYKDRDGNGLVYVSATTEMYEDEDMEMRTRVSYFLEPKDYHQFDLLYPRTRTETTTYLNYIRDLSAKTETGELLGNHSYEFSILKSLGIVMEEDPDSDWDDDGAPIEVDVEEFIKAVNRGESYSQQDEYGNEVEILESSVNGTILLRNVDFHHAYYDIIDGDFVPDLSLTFDGNHHYIKNMACPLFNSNNGSITNLGIIDASTNPDRPLESNEKYQGIHGGQADFSRNGIICRTNIGTITNVRLYNVDLTVEIKTSGSTYEESSREAHNAALLVGSNRGTMANIHTGGTMKILVKNATGVTTLPNVMVGSIAGQNLGLITGVSSIDDENYTPPVYKVINECEGSSGVYIIGGVAGSNTGSIYDVMMSDVTVDGSLSSGVESLMGGIAGNMPVSTSGAPEIDSCILRGVVIAGSTQSVVNINSNSYTGGVVGLMNIQGIVTNSSVSVGVTGTDYYDRQVTYGIGGAFGGLEMISGVTEGKIETLACFGSHLSGITNRTGNFAGVAPAGFTLEEHYAGKNINVKQYSGKPDIAAYQ